MFGLAGSTLRDTPRASRRGTPAGMAVLFLSYFSVNFDIDGSFCQNLVLTQNEG